MLHRRPHPQHAIWCGALKALFGALDNLLRGVGITRDRIMVFGGAVPALLGPSDVIPFKILDDDAELAVGQGDLLGPEITLASLTAGSLIDCCNVERNAAGLIGNTLAHVGDNGLESLFRNAPNLLRPGRKLAINADLIKC